MRTGGAALGWLLVMATLSMAACGFSDTSVLAGGRVVHWEDINSQVLPAVVRLRVRTCDALGSGSGFFVNPLTITSNEHVVHGFVTLSIDAPADLGEARDARVPSDGTDISFITAPIETRHWLPLAEADPVPGDLVEVIGFPGGGEQSVSTGRVIALADGSDYGVDGTIIVSDATVRPGNSGGPMVNTDGEVVGVVTALEFQKGRGLAIPVSELRESLAEPTRSASSPC